jgi:hypothetical protein
MCTHVYWIVTQICCILKNTFLNVIEAGLLIHNRTLMLVLLHTIMYIYYARYTHGPWFCNILITCMYNLLNLAPNGNDIILLGLCGFVRACVCACVHVRICPRKYIMENNFLKCQPINNRIQVKGADQYNRETSIFGHNVCPVADFLLYQNVSIWSHYDTD